MSTPSLTFVDHVGGELAAVAAALASGRSLTAHATTTVTPREVGPEAHAVLREVAAPSPSPVRPFDPATANGDVIELGGDSIANRRASLLDVKRYEGPQTTPFGDASLERLALLRIARDRIEAYFDRAAPP